MNRTYKLERLFHQLLKPRGIPSSELPFVIIELENSGFIETLIDANKEVTRYIETPKLVSGLARKELFKILQGFENETRDKQKSE